MVKGVKCLLCRKGLKRRRGIQPGKYDMVEVYRTMSSMEKGVGNDCSAFSDEKPQGHQMK